MAKLIDLMRQAGVQWPDGAEYAAQDGDDGVAMFYTKAPKLDGEIWCSTSVILRKSLGLPEVADDWQTYVTREQWFSAQPARSQERRDLVRELMLRHPELTGPQAIEQADEILSTLEGLRDGC